MEIEKTKNILLDKLLAIGIIKHGNFILKSGISSSIYFDFRILNSYPAIFKYIVLLATPIINKIKLENPNRILRILGIPMGAIPIATILSQYFNIPSLLLRTTPKKHGLGKFLEGEYNLDDIIILVDDVFTSGSSITETTDFINNNIGGNFDVSNILVILDRSSGNTISKFPKLNSIFTINDLTIDKINSSISEFPIFQNKFANNLYRIAYTKKSNIIVAIDFNYTYSIINLIENIGSYIAGIKLHIDIIHDMDIDFIAKLNFLKKKHNLVIIEDIKAGDISEITLAKLHNPRNGILEWADAITVHCLSGLPKIGDLEIELIPVIEMSCKSIITSEYIKLCLNEIQKIDNKIAGCVLQHTEVLNHKWQFLTLTPGININTSIMDTSSNQQYTNPLENSSKTGLFWIIGRGITSQEDVIKTVSIYQNAGWRHFIDY
jgi:uridine monophosphate synthetase